ncbi:Cna B-type domain-containing protein [[Clostridium] innocuum]|nr:Cna B-type domain-containing protein [[Clostridium] innocuum]
MMKRKKKVLLAVLMAFTLMVSCLSSTPSVSLYAQDGVLSDTMSETGNDGPAVTSTDDKNRATLENEEQSKIEKASKGSDEIEEKDIATIANGTVATVDGKEYSSLKEAIDSITGSGTVTLVSDAELSETITIPKDVTVTLTTDENKHTVNMISTNLTYNISAFVVEKGGTLIIDSNDLTITRNKYTSNISGLILCYGTLQLENGILDFNDNQTDATSEATYVNGVVEVYGKDAVFMMNGGIIKNACLSNYSGGVKVCAYGKFIMNGGTITHIQGKGNLKAGAVLVVASSSALRGVGTAYFEMNGGVIENNSGYRGAGVYVVGVDFNYRATMVMNNGTIRNNTCTGWGSGKNSFPSAGAGIYIENNAVVTMNDGNIVNNTVNNGMGGAVATADGFYDTFDSVESAEQQGYPIETWSYFYPAGFTMNDGTINGNKATMGEISGDGGCGGGIYSASNTVTLKGGIIENNEAERQGGGVYVGSIPYTLTIYDALVTNNEASILGGGVWACPTGDTEVFVTNGVGIYDNTSNGAGDDVVSVKTVGIDHVLTLADRILGGGQVLWYKDGGITNDGSILGNPDSSSRYTPGDTPISQIKNNKDPYALKATVSDNAKKLAHGNAKLLIRNNRSARGGGIGTNGGIVMGEKDNEYTLKVKKDWKDTDDSLKQAVTVYLKVGDTVLDPVTLNKDNNWQAEFKDLPDPDTLDEVSYAVVENPVPENFTVEYQEAEIDKDDRTITIDITNTYHAPKLGGLTVEKEVTGTHGDKTKDFHFTVTLDDTSINGKYGDMTFTDGVAEITLKHGGKATATGLPAGIGYVVLEKEANDDGYTTTSTADKGTIPENDNINVKFTNHKEIKLDEPENHLHQMNQRSQKIQIQTNLTQISQAAIKTMAA